MSKIVKPFGRVVSRVVIEVDHNQQIKIEAVEMGTSITRMPAVGGLITSNVPMNPVKFALLLTSVLTSVLSTFKLPGEIKNAETSKGASGDGDGNSRS